jgi:hypothetical protein
MFLTVLDGVAIIDECVQLTVTFYQPTALEAEGCVTIIAY